MITSFGKVHFLAWAVLSTSASVNCSTSSPKQSHGTNAEESGSIGLELQLPNGAHADTAHYAISGPSGFLLEGTIDVSNSPTISALIGGIPPGGSYVITVSVTSTDTTVNCVGQAPFAVESHATTNVDVMLRCRPSAHTGSIIINGTLNLCPSVDMFGALPLATKVGSSIALTSLASDLDHVPNAISYHWTGPFGFDATTPNATFSCTSAGMHTIALSVTDGDPGCEATSTATVTCNPDNSTGTGGSGGAAGAGPGGSGGSGGTGGPDAGSDGHVVTVEEILAARSAACLTCAQTNCAAEMGGCLGLRGQMATAGSATGTSRETLCTDALACVLPPGAASCGSGFLNACYCGSAVNEACLMVGSPDGVCKAAIEAGLETSDPVSIAVSFAKTTLGAGAAMFLAQCLDGTCDTCFQP